MNFTEFNFVLTIYDLTGKIVLVQNISSDLEKIDISNLNKGSYIGILKNSNLKERFKILKE